MNILGYSLKITNESGLYADLYDDPEFLVTSTSGFGLDAEISTTANTEGGSMLNSIILPERTLTFNVQYQDVPDPEAAKLRLHRVMAFKQRLKIEYVSNNISKWIYGYCEKCETPENAYPMTTNITIVCPDPYWNVGTSGSEVNTVEFVNGQCSIFYAGDVPTGVRVILSPTSSIVVVSFTINNQTLTSDNLLNATGPGWVDVIQSYEPGDIVVFDTRDHYKAVLLNGLDRFQTTKVGDPYPQLTPGQNNLSIVADGTFTAICEYAVKSGG